MAFSSRHASAGPPCRNLNHGRLDAPVRHCPSCGVVVNDAIVATRCSEREHDGMRRHCEAYCTGCGVQLIAD